MAILDDLNVLRQAWSGVSRLTIHNPQETGFTKYRARHSAGATGLAASDWRPLSAISPYVICAIVHSEDPMFFRHHGFWWDEIERQIQRSRRTGQPVRGVSSISQQLARNLFLRPERSIQRKLLEALITVQLERVLTKQRILELYLNVVEWGPNTWGIEAAARRYCARSSDSLTPFQAIYLTTLLPAPLRPFAGPNGMRMVRAQRRLAALLYGCGIIKRSEEQSIYNCIDALEQSIGRDESLARLAATAQGKEHSESENKALPTLATLVVQECGFAQRCAFEAVMRESPLVCRGVSIWPEWWGVPLARTRDANAELETTQVST